MCRAEGPAVEQFAQEHGDEVRVVGMGAQDDLDRAQEFLTATGVATPLMLWDSGFESWFHYDVRSQPTAILVDAQGTPIQGWRGAIDTEAVLELAANA